jgi:hypothetical protein
MSSRPAEWNRKRKPETTEEETVRAGMTRGSVTGAAAALLLEGGSTLAPPSLPCPLVTMTAADAFALHSSLWFGDSADEVQGKTKRALEVVFKRADALGMIINTKPNKTEAMPFSPFSKKGDNPAPFVRPVTMLALRR